MIGRIKIGTGESEREITLRATAATDIRYKQVFGEDCLPKLLSVAKLAETLPEGAADWREGEDMPPEAIEAYIKLVEDGTLQVIQQLAYILNASAERKDMARLDVVDYIEWLDDLEPLDLLVNMAYILDVYFGGKATASTLTAAAKKNRLAPTVL